MPRFDTDFDYDDWEYQMRQKDILDGYFGNKKEVKNGEGIRETI